MDEQKRPPEHPEPHNKPPNPMPGQALSPTPGFKPSEQRPQFKQARRTRRISPFRWAVIILTGVLTSVATFFGIGYFFNPPDIEFSVPGMGGKVISIRTPKSPGIPSEKILLLMGVDSNNDGTKDSFKGVRTDSIMLARISPYKNTVSVVSIPRDSKVYIGHGQGSDKINSAYAYGGAELTIATIEQSFGIPVDNYLVINTHGVREMVDAMGGVRIYVEKPMKYRDRTAGLSINFEPGYHNMNGTQAEGYLRFRHDALGDIGRIRRQQNFLSAVSEKFRNPLMLAKLPALVETATQYVDTDLTPQEMLQLAWFGKDLEMSRVRVAILPGTPGGNGVSYWLIEPQLAEMVLNRLILDNPDEGWDSGEDAETPLRVGVFYAPEVADKLDTLVSRLEAGNFKVVCKTARANSTTQIVEHSRRVNDENTNRLRESTELLGKARLIFAPVGTTFESNVCSPAEDYTVILGDDMRSKDA